MNEERYDGERGTKTAKAVECSALLDADEILGKVLSEMEAEFQKDGLNWPRNWMQKHVNDRAALIQCRRILIDRAEASNAKFCNGLEEKQ